MIDNNISQQRRQVCREFVFSKIGCGYKKYTFWTKERAILSFWFWNQDIDINDIECLEFNKANKISIYIKSKEADDYGGRNNPYIIGKINIETGNFYTKNHWDKNRVINTFITDHPEFNINDVICIKIKDRKAFIYIAYYDEYQYGGKNNPYIIYLSHLGHKEKYSLSPHKITERYIQKIFSQQNPDIDSKDIVCVGFKKINRSRNKYAIIYRKDLPENIYGGKNDPYIINTGSIKDCCYSLKGKNRFSGERQMRIAIEHSQENYLMDLATIPNSRQRPDFTLTDLNIFIEVNGNQHYLDEIRISEDIRKTKAIKCNTNYDLICFPNPNDKKVPMESCITIYKNKNGKNNGELYLYKLKNEGILDSRWWRYDIKIIDM